MGGFGKNSNQCWHQFTGNMQYIHNFDGLRRIYCALTSVSGICLSTKLLPHLYLVTVSLTPSTQTLVLKCTPLSQRVPKYEDKRREKNKINNKKIPQFLFTRSERVTLMSNVDDNIFQANRNVLNNSEVLPRTVAITSKQINVLF